MNINIINSETKQSFAGLRETLSALDNQQLNTVPFSGSWTAGQTVQHIILSGTGFVQLINGPVAETLRNPDEMEQRIKTIFLDFSTKMKSPDFVVPPDDVYTKEGLINTLNALELSIEQASRLPDLSLTCLAFQLPVLGNLTRSEALCFIAYHTRRHLHQLQNISEKLSEQEAPLYAK